MESSQPTLTIACRRVRAGAVLPQRMTGGASGFDLHACLESSLVLDPGSWSLVPTGLVVAIPPGYEGTVRARSGLALRHGVGLLNGPGTIDSDYRGEVGVLLMNWGPKRFEICPGDRIAQIVFAAVPAAEIVWTDSVPETTRGAGGFGHTGISPDPGGVA